MKVGLFIPCYIDMLYPEVGIATMQLLERFGVDVHYPTTQTCCGQPLSNNGDQAHSAVAQQLFIKTFKDYDYIVGPSGSCVKEVRHHFDAIPQTPEVTRVRERTFELVEFLHDILKVQEFPWAYFPHSVGIHNSCSAVRGLGLAKPSEIMGNYFNKTEALLRKVKGIIMVQISRPDDCCGFGGSFCVTDEAVSARMGLEKVNDHLRNGAEYIVSPDMSCVMHMQGIGRRDKLEVEFLHVAQVLNGGPFSMEEIHA
jgi:L-lactate dehydrogenase complex protein LldE